MASTFVPQCPSCSRVLYFSHAETTLLQCTCGTVVQRKEGDFLVARPFYIIPEPVDIIQPGTTGTWEGNEFKVLGRFRTWLKESVINYWTILLHNGKLAYLAEGYGIYAVLKKSSTDQLLTGGFLADLKTGTKKQLIKDEDFLLEKLSACRKWEVEGEAWLPECHSSFSIYDFAGVNGRYITLIQFLPNLIFAYDVVYTTYSALNLCNTRLAQMPGKTFRCTRCEHLIVVKAYPFSQSCACSNCGNFYHLREDGFKQTGQYASLDIGPDIVLGSRGKVDGIEYDLIGYALKEEANQYHSQWKEYTLYNREEGYAFLSEYNGHWIYLREQGKAPVLKNNNVKSFVYEGEDFQLFNGYRYTILNARGEFTYNIFNTEGTYAKEFISPPEIWIQEQNKREGIIWFHGHHVSGSDLKTGFEFPAGLPHKEGIGAVEPRFFISPIKLVRMTVLGIAFLLVLQMIISSSKQNRVLLDQTYTFLQPDSSNSTGNILSVVTPPFYLDKWRSNLEFSIYAPVENDWFELNATLVNKKTGAEYILEKGVEYYRGYTDGENWTEGSKKEEAYLSQIPRGEYILQLQGIRSAASGHVSNFHVIVTYDTTMDRNFWFSVLALLVWPVVQYIRTNKNEKKRWENSPFTPFSYED